MMGKSKSKRKANLSSPRGNSKVSDHAKLKLKALLKQQGIRKPTKQSIVSATKPDKTKSKNNLVNSKPIKENMSSANGSPSPVTPGKTIKSKNNFVKSKPVKENMPSANGSSDTSNLESNTSAKSVSSDSSPTVKNESRKTNGSAKILPLSKKLNSVRKGKSKADLPALQTLLPKAAPNAHNGLEKKNSNKSKKYVIVPKRSQKISGSTSNFVVSDCTPSIYDSPATTEENATFSKLKKTARKVSTPPTKTKKRKRQNGTTKTPNKKQKLLVPDTKLPTSASNSDSESESYIDRFFASQNNGTIVSEEDTQINEFAIQRPDSSEEDNESEHFNYEECCDDHCDGHSSDYVDYSAEEVETDGESIQFSNSESEETEQTAINNDITAKEQNNGMELVTYSDRHSQEEDFTTSDDESCIYFGSNDSYNSENDSVPGESDESFDDNDNWSSFDSNDESSSSFDDYEFEEDTLTDSSDESHANYREFLSGRASDDPNDKEYTNDDYLFICRGRAKVYGLENNEVTFNSEDDGPQIIEISSSRHTTGYSSDDSCPELVPIDPAAYLSNDTKPGLVVTVDENHTFQDCPIALHQSYDTSYDEDHNASIQEIMLRNHTIVSTVDSRLSENVEITEEIIIPKIDPVKLSDSKVPEVDKGIEILNKKPDLQNSPGVEDEYEDVDPIVRPRFYNSLNSRQVLLLIKSPLHFHGILNLKLLAGKAEVYGYELKPNEPVTAYSPRGHSFINITPSMPAATDTIENAGKILEVLRSDFLLSDIREALHQYDPLRDAILLIERGDAGNKAFNMIDKYMKQTVFPNAQAFSNRRPYYAAETILHCQFLLRPRTQLVSSSQWMSVSVQPKSRIMVIGGKGVGKSTLVRHLINRNLPKNPRILLIDLDIGQPELFTPQTVSATCLNEPILGPGYMKHCIPDQAFLFGDINVVLSPIKYIKCVLRLIRHCQNKAEYQNIPWIVNTMGYNRGFGLELTVAALKALEPTDLIQINGHRSADNFDRTLSCDEVNGFKFNIFQDEVNAFGDITDCRYETHIYDSMARRSGERTNEWDMSAKDLRFAMILAHLGNALIGSSEWITDVKPCCASLNDLTIITTNDDHIDEDLVANLINANLVYLCRTNDDQTEIIECFGIGIVRCVDRVSNKVYLLPTIPLDQMTQVNVLAICNIPLPTSVLLNRSNRIQGLVPYVYKTDDFVGSKQIVQITYRPERFSQNKHNNPLK